MPDHALPHRRLLLAHVVAIAVPYLLIATNDFDDVDDVAVGFLAIYSTIGFFTAAIHSWLIARLDRRLVGPSRNRWWALLEGPAAVTIAVGLPISCHAAFVAALGVVSGSGRMVEQGAFLVPGVLCLLVGGALRWGARRLYAGRVALQADDGTWGDLVPTSWLWATWLFSVGGLGTVALVAIGSKGSPWFLAACLGGWCLAAAVGVAAAARRVGGLQLPTVPEPAALALEVGGATALGLLLPLFFTGLFEMSSRQQDARWAVLLSTLLLVPAAVWVHAWGRATRWARWM